MRLFLPIDRHSECLNVFISISLYYAGETCVAVKTETDGNDITEHSYDDKPAVQSAG